MKSKTTKKNVWRDTAKSMPKKSGLYLCLIAVNSDDGNTIEDFLVEIGFYHSSKNRFGFNSKLDKKKCFIYAWKELSEIPEKYLKLIGKKYEE